MRLRALIRLALVLLLTGEIHEVRAQESPQPVGFAESASFYCADGVTKPKLPGPGNQNFLFGFPRRPTRTLCTVGMSVPLTDEMRSASTVEIALDVSGPALRASDGLLVVAEQADSGGQVSRRRFGFPHQTGKDKATVVLRYHLVGNPSSLKLYVIAKDGHALGVHRVNLVAGPSLSGRREDGARGVPSTVRALVNTVLVNFYSDKPPMNFHAVEEEVFGMSSGAPDNQSTILSAARNLFRILGLNHSFVYTGRTYLADKKANLCPEWIEIEEPAISHQALKITVTQVPGPMACAMPYALAARKRIAAALARHPSSEVTVDLRDNEGGNMYPMLYVLLPFLKEGRLLGMENRAGLKTQWVINENGRLSVDHSPTFPDLPRQGATETRRLSALVCTRTASSGEVVAVALRNSGAKIRGLPTRGLLTSNVKVELPHGVTMLLTTGKIISPDGSRTDQVDPDEVDPEVCE